MSQEWKMCLFSLKSTRKCYAILNVFSEITGWNYKIDILQPHCQCGKLSIHTSWESVISSRGRDFPKIRDSRAVSPIPFDSKSHSFPTKSPKKDHTNEAKRKETGKGGSQSVTFCHPFSVERITSNREKTCLGRTFPPWFQVKLPLTGACRRHNIRTKKMFFQPNEKSFGWDWRALFLNRA